MTDRRTTMQEDRGDLSRFVLTWFTAIPLTLIFLVIFDGSYFFIADNRHSCRTQTYDARSIKLISVLKSLRRRYGFEKTILGVAPFL